MLKTTILLTLLTLLLTNPASAQPIVTGAPGDVGIIPTLTPQQSIATIQVPPGYHLQLVAAEPMVQEPVMFAFDGNGALYVCEWLTYMQDEHGSGEKDPISRVVKLVDTDGDGLMDKRTVFIDQVVLPRSILPLHDRVLVNLTQSNSIWSYFDDNNDGVSDRRELAFKGNPNKGNIEHQASGLVWNLDNHIDTNYERLRYQNGKLIPSPHSVGRITQWGLTRDDDGRLYNTWAGGANPAHSFQMPAGYPIVTLDEHAEDYRTPYAICETEDQSSGGYDYENNRVLTSFSACCGQSMIRSGIMPDLEGILATCEPVGRFIRGTRFEWINGKGTAHNAYPGNEFIRSTDTYFRPVWTQSGPDGGLYIADMYRGIIQHKQWFPTEGDHPWVKRYQRAKGWGMIEVNRHGRIYRLIPNKTKTYPQPNMLNQSSAQLVPYLDHPNGWWRDNAQKLIVCRGDKSVAPALQKMALHGQSPNARINAMWTLQGLDALKKQTVLTNLDHLNQRVRMASIHLAEQWLTKADPTITKRLTAMLSSNDPHVVTQLYNTFSDKNSPDSTAIRQRLLHSNPNHTLLTAIVEQAKNKALLAQLNDSAKRGKAIYETLCTTCHGERGLGNYEADKLLAPPIAESRLFTGGNKNIPIIARVLLKGMTGPLEGVTYGEGIMIPVEEAYNDQQIADVINFVASRWNKRSWKSPATEQDIAKARHEVIDRKTPWTEAELKAATKALGL